MEFREESEAWGWGGGTDSNAAETWVLLWMCWVVCGTKVPPGERS